MFHMMLIKESDAWRVMYFPGIRSRDPRMICIDNFRQRFPVDYPTVDRSLPGHHCPCRWWLLQIAIMVNQ